MPRDFIAVIGAGVTDEPTLEIAEEVGRLIAKRDSVLICGGLGGVMEAAARGVKSGGGITVGILPQNHKDGANPYIDLPIATGFGEGRNMIIVRTADAIIAVGGGHGTLSEIAFGLKTGKPVIGIKTWDIEGVMKAGNAKEAVDMAFLKGLKWIQP